MSKFKFDANGVQIQRKQVSSKKFKEGKRTKKRREKESSENEDSENSPSETPTRKKQKSESQSGELSSVKSEIPETIKQQTQIKQKEDDSSLKKLFFQEYDPNFDLDTDMNNLAFELDKSKKTSLKPGDSVKQIAAMKFSKNDSINLSNF